MGDVFQVEILRYGSKKEKVSRKALMQDLHVGKKRVIRS
jgi:hypothetical protein